jgi:3-deoxy-7-phosphoheptulonate synthase
MKLIEKGRGRICPSRPFFVGFKTLVKAPKINQKKSLLQHRAHYSAEQENPIGDDRNMNALRLASLNGDRTMRTVVNVDGVKVGKDFVVIAGPCSVESEKQTIMTAIKVKEAGANMLRGGAFKPRTSPYDFQGLGLQGLKILEKAKKATGLPVVTEVTDPRDVSWVCEYADVLQIGTRNMQNFSLLQEVGKVDRPVLLKRGMYSTLKEWLNCAEYILSEGNPNVILCERGIRTFETYTRNTLDLSIVPSVKEVSHLPIIVDPSHGTGRLSIIEPMSFAAMAAGADGIIVEVHYNPCEALCDKDQAMPPDMFSIMMQKLVRLGGIMSQIKNGNGSEQ